MKWCFKLLLVIFFSSAAYSKNIEATYTVKGKGVPIGILKWELEIKNGFYKTFIYLKAQGQLHSYTISMDHIVQLEEKLMVILPLRCISKGG